jgi:hypothetical protein
MPSHTAPGRAPMLRPVTSPEEPSPVPRTTGQAWMARRDLIAAIAGSNGASLRMPGDVFDLPHSRIHAILKKHRAKYPGAGTAGPMPRARHGESLASAAPCRHSYFQEIILS